MTDCIVFTFFSVAPAKDNALEQQKERGHSLLDFTLISIRKIRNQCIQKFAIQRIISRKSKHMHKYHPVLPSKRYAVEYQVMRKRCTKIAICILGIQEC